MLAVMFQWRVHARRILPGVVTSGSASRFTIHHRRPAAAEAYAYAAVSQHKSKSTNLQQRDASPGPRGREQCYAESMGSGLFDSLLPKSIAFVAARAQG